MKPEFSQRVFEKSSNIKYHDNSRTSNFMKIRPVVRQVEQMLASVTGGSKIIRHKFQCELLSKGPSVIGRKGWILRSLSGKPG